MVCLRPHTACIKIAYNSGIFWDIKIGLGTGPIQAALETWLIQIACETLGTLV